MRITAGTYKNHKLYVPKGDHIRPTTDMVRQAIFNVLKGYDLPEGAHVLDGFCGTGALGLEALSRGGIFCTFVDISGESLDACRKNIKALGVEEHIRTIKKNLVNTQSRAEGVRRVNLVFLDPPYRKGLVPQAMEALANSNWLAENAIFVTECEKQETVETPDGFVEDDNREYGDTRVQIFLYKG